MRAKLRDAGYELRADAERHVGAAVGTGVHAGASYMLDEMRVRGDLGAASEAEQRAVAALEAEMQFGVSWDDATPGLSVAQRQVQRMVRTYRRHTAPGLRPTLVEQRLIADVGDGWRVSGQADTLADDPNEAIHDLKTGTRRRANAVQYGAYGIVTMAHGYQPVRAVEDYVARVAISADQPAPVAIPVPLAAAMEEAWASIDDIKAGVAEFERRAADPSGTPPIQAFRPNPASALCGPRWCPAHGTEACRIHKQETTR